MVAWVGPAIAAAGNFLGGVLGQDASDDASRLARQQVRFQLKAAKRGITWRVKDAINAGIHPLYALGAQTFSPSPVSVSGGSPMAEGVAAMGQGLGQAVTAGLSAHQTQAQALAESLSLERAHLENNLIRGQIDALKGLGKTSMPGQRNDPDPLAPNQLQTPLGVITRDPKAWSSAQKFQDEGGELAEWVWGTIQHLHSIFSSASPSSSGRTVKQFPYRHPNWMRGLGGTGNR